MNQTDEETKKEFMNIEMNCNEYKKEQIADWWISKLHTLQEEYKKELIEKIGKIGVDLGEGRVLDIAWSDLKQNIITIINNSN